MCKVQTHSSGLFQRGTFFQPHKCHLQYYHVLFFSIFFQLKQCFILKILTGIKPKIWNKLRSIFVNRFLTHLVTSSNLWNELAVILKQFPSSSKFVSILTLKGDNAFLCQYTIIDQHLFLFFISSSSTSLNPQSLHHYFLKGNWMKYL